jgi:hypothetical protein
LCYSNIPCSFLFLHYNNIIDNATESSMTTTTNAAPTEVKMALGRLFSMMMRPARDGDVAMYNAIRAIVLDSSPTPAADYRPNYVAQRLQGAQGD